MGGNNSYSKGWGGVPKASRTHTFSEYKVDGHKVVFSTGNPEQKKNILNANTKNATYLIATKSDEGIIQIHNVNVFDGINLAYEINLKFDAEGNVKPFSTNENGSHAHYWAKDDKEKLGRKSHDKSNHHEIDHKFDKLIADIVAFNKKHKKYEKRGE